MSNNKLTMDELVQKVNALKEKTGVDISTTEDLSLAVMNLISLEEHFFFTGAKTKKDEYFDMAEEIREMRKKLLAELLPEHEGETWCASKHLLATTMRLIEVGNKLQSDGKKPEAKQMFEKAYKIYSIFWALKLKLVGVSLKKASEKEKTEFRLEDLVSKLADCCKE